MDGDQTDTVMIFFDGGGGMLLDSCTYVKHAHMPTQVLDQTRLLYIC